MTDPKSLVETIAVNFARAVYVPIKRFTKTTDKVVYISRQEDKLPSDMKLVMDEFGARHPSWEQVALAHTLGTGAIQRLRYIPHMLKQMRQIASARLVVLDSYCISVSVLKHKPNLKVMQMWHAYGALKRFAFSLIDTPAGINDAGSLAMHMHENYDMVLASSTHSATAFAEAFNVPRRLVKVRPLPRTDLLTNPDYRAQLRERILQAHPELVHKKIALFVPTFRDSANVETAQLMTEFANTDYEVVVKGHPFVTDNQPALNAIEEFTGQDLLSIADVVITDYSSIVFEAALMKLPVYFWTPDLDDYTTERNFYIDFRHDVPGEKFTDPRRLVAAVTAGTADLDALEAFTDEYVEYTAHATADIVDELDNFIS